ncbi:hypothetical protein Bca4012_026024 [Brassica carinata]
MGIWEELFKGEEKPTVVWIMDRLLKGKRYKDPLTRLRLALLVLVEGIVCPTCGVTNIRPEVVNRLGDIEEFLKYPWGNIRCTRLFTCNDFVAITACPSIIVKEGGGDPLADATLSTSEIIRHVADVRYYVCDDPEGDLLSQGLGDRDDASVNNLVSMILEDYPFEHNLFVGGVKAEDVKLKKAPPASPQSSADNVSSGGDKEKDTDVGAKVNVKHRDGGSSKVPHSADPLHEENIGLDVPTLLRRAADAYEEKVIPMFEGYILSLKAHLDNEVGVLRTDLKTVTKSIRGLDAKVSTEFEKIRTLIKCGGYSEDDPAVGGTSPYRQTSPYGSGPDDLPPPFVPPQHTTRMYPAPGGGESSSPPDVSAPSQDSIPHPSDTVPPAVDTRGVTTDSWNDSNVPPPPFSVQKETTNVQYATKEVQSTEAEAHPTKVTSVHPPPVQSQPRGDEEIASPTEPIPHESQSGKEQEDPTAESSIFPDVSEVVTKILADSGISKDIPQSTSMSGTVGGVSSSSNPKVPLKAQEIPQAGSPSGKVGGQSTSNDPNVPLNAEAVSELPAVGQTQRQVRFEEKSDVGVLKDDGDASKEVERRHSTRTTRKTKKFTPPAPPPKKGANKKPQKPAESNAQAAKRSKKAAAESSQPTPTPPRTDLPVFIGGFNAFTPPSAADREAFFRRLSWSTPLSTTFAGLKDLFQCTGVCTHEPLDRVVHTLRMRRDRLPGPRFDFFPPSFYVEFVRNHSGFEAAIDKTRFSFSRLSGTPSRRPAWYKEVDFVYTPVLIKNSHWVGVIIDLHMAAIYVVDFNQACPSEFDVVGVLTPISVMLPYLIHKHCIIPGTRQINFIPFPISRIQVPMLLEHPGYSAVAALILLEVAAAGKPLTDISGTEADVRQAAENYAIAALRIC